MVNLSKNVYTQLDVSGCKQLLESFGYGVTNSLDYSVVVVVAKSDELSNVLNAIDKRTTFVIGVVDNGDETIHLKGLSDAWILSSSIEKLPQLIESYKVLIDNRIAVRDSLIALGTIAMHEGVHKENLGAIKTIMQQTTSEIETIFKSRVEEMKAIHTDAQYTEKQLSLLRENMQPQEFYDLEEAWESTRSIVSRTDEVIKAMFSFVTVLQCEDRLTQMMDGIATIMSDDVQKIGEFYPFDAPELYEKFKRDLQGFYTIQEQRDFVMGMPLRVDGCQGHKQEVSSIDEIELF